MPNRQRPVFDDVFRIEVAVRPALGEVTLAVSGDFDEESTASFDAFVEAGLRTGLFTVVHLDGVGVFGAAASRAVERALRSATDQGAELEIRGVPRHVTTVLDIVGLDDPRVNVGGAHRQGLSATEFDPVLARGLMHVREAVAITTAGLDPRIVFVNSAFSELTGHPADRLLGGSIRVLSGAAHRTTPPGRPRARSAPAGRRHGRQRHRPTRRLVRLDRPLRCRPRDRGLPGRWTAVLGQLQKQGHRIRRQPVPIDPPPGHDPGPTARSPGSSSSSDGGVDGRRRRAR